MADAENDPSPAKKKGKENRREFEDFEGLTRRLLRVPKEELGAKLAEHKNGAKTPSPSTRRK